MKRCRILNADKATGKRYSPECSYIPSSFRRSDLSVLLYYSVFFLAKNSVYHVRKIQRNLILLSSQKIQFKFLFFSLGEENQQSIHRSCYFQEDSECLRGRSQQGSEVDLSRKQRTFRRWGTDKPGRSFKLSTRAKVPDQQSAVQTQQLDTLIVTLYKNRSPGPLGFGLEPAAVSFTAADQLPRCTRWVGGGPRGIPQCWSRRCIISVLSSLSYNGPSRPRIGRSRVFLVPPRWRVRGGLPNV